MQKKSIIDLQRMDVDKYHEITKIPLVVVLDNVRSLHNVGSVFRSADAFKIESIYLCGITSTPPHADIHKTALGAEDSVVWYYKSSSVMAVQELLEKGYIVYAIEQVFGSITLEALTLDKNKKYAIVLGNEVKGVEEAVIACCNGSIEIPQYGTKHSLNVSVTAGIVMWDCFKQLK